jgi:hypothetical protein
LTSGGIAVAGFASSVDTLAAIDSQHTLATLLEAEITLERPDVAVLSAAAVVESLGGEAYGDLMEEFAQSGEIDSATLKSISRMLPDVRYAVFARLEEDVISESESRRASPGCCPMCGTRFSHASKKMSSANRNRVGRRMIAKTWSRCPPSAR